MSVCGTFVCSGEVSVVERCPLRERVLCREVSIVGVVPCREVSVLGSFLCREVSVVGSFLCKEVSVVGRCPL